MSTAGYHVNHRTQGSVVMYINSADAHTQHENTTHFSFSFKEAIHTRPGEGMLVSLHSASIPYSFYNIRSGVNNTLILLGGGGEFTITIPEGNYNVKSFATKITELVLPNLAGGQTFAMEFDAPSQKFKYTLGAGSNLEMKTGEANSPYVEMGFEQTDHELTQNTITLSTNIADINGSVHALYLRTNLPSKSVFESLSAGVSDVLDKIALNTNPGGIIVHNPRDRGVETLLETNHVRSLTCRLTDERNRVLNLNGLHFQFGLLFEFVELLTPVPRVVESKPPEKPEKKTQSRQQQKKQRRKRALKRGKKKVSDAVDRATKTSAPQKPQKQSPK